jgi:hypothetical protein
MACKPYDHEQDKKIDALLDEAELARLDFEPERFAVERPDLSKFVFLVRDKLTGRVREATNDPLDALAISTWLNAGHVYIGGEVMAS